MSRLDEIKKLRHSEEAKLENPFGYDDIDWMISHIERSKTLLNATYRLLKKCEESPFVVNVMSEEVDYDDAECDGYCLMEDIAGFLDIDEE